MPPLTLGLVRREGARRHQRMADLAGDAVVRRRVEFIAVAAAVDAAAAVAAAVLAWADDAATVAAALVAMAMPSVGRAVAVAIVFRVA